MKSILLSTNDLLPQDKIPQSVPQRVKTSDNPKPLLPEATYLKLQHAPHHPNLLYTILDGTLLEPLHQLILRLRWRERDDSMRVKYNRF